MKHSYLMTPGPSPLAPGVKQALGKDIIHHRTDEFRAILKEVETGLKEIIKTDNPVLVLASSGTGAMQAAVSNLLSKNDKVLTVIGGKFGERWQQICNSFGVEAIPLEVEWGNGPSLDKIKEILENNPDIKAIYTTLCETSTATVFDIKGISQIAQEKGVLTVVDAISGLGQDVLKADEWGVDVVVGGSQKGLMLPPGLAFISLSEKAQKAMEKSDIPKYYFNLKKALSSAKKNDTPWTAPVNLVVALRQALKIIKSEGIENRWAEYERIAQATRKALESLGLTVFSKSPSLSVTAVCIEGIDTTQVVKKMRKEYGVSIAGGQADLKGKIIRIAHMGYINAQDMVMCLFVLEKVLQDLGLSFEKGMSTKTFGEVYYG